MAIILGIDPGTQITGFGVIQIQSRGKMEALDYGCIRPPARLVCYERYNIIFDGIEALLDKFQPTAMAIETQFVHRNAQTAMKLGIARGMALLAATRRKIPIFEYAPKKAKRAVVGNGSASKEQVQRMMQILLDLPQLPTPEDAADALAIAMCHAHTLEPISKLFGAKNRTFELC